MKDYEKLKRQSELYKELSEITGELAGLYELEEATQEDMFRIAFLMKRFFAISSEMNKLTK